jgi:hypothetical protein
MSWTKRQFINKAYGVIGLASYAYDLTPEELQDAMTTMDSMMATWNAKGIRLGYPIPSSPENSDLDDETNVPDAANEAIYLNLAIRIALGKGKVVLPDTKIIAREAYKSALMHTSEVIEKQMPETMPLGAGHKSWRSRSGPYVTPPTDPITVGGDGELDF